MFKQQYFIYIKVGAMEFPRLFKKQNKIPESVCPALCAQTSFNDVSLKLLEKKHRQAMHPYQDRQPTD